MSQPWQRQLLRGYLQLCQLPAPSLVQLDEALAQLHHGQPDSAPCLQFGELELRRSFGLLYAMAPLGPLPHGQTLQVSLLQQSHQQWPLAAPLRGLQTAWVTEGPRLAAQALQAPLQLTYGLPGSTSCHPHYRQQARELKKVWQEAQVPVWLRPRLPILVSGDKVLAIVGVFVDAASQAQDSAPGLQLSLQLP